MPLDVAEIMPQYPEGIKAVIAFLKRNIQSPKDFNDSEEVTVKNKICYQLMGK